VRYRNCNRARYRPSVTAFGELGLLAVGVRPALPFVVMGSGVAGGQPVRRE